MGPRLGRDRPHPANEAAEPRRKCGERSAFTLIELLIVIGIIGILIGILLPVTARARREAKKVACKTRLHDVGAAMQMYLNENRGWYPPARYSAEFLATDPAQQRPLVIEFLRPYYTRLENHNSEIFHCPADDDDQFAQYGLSYSYYEELGDLRLEKTFFFKIMRSSSRTPVLWDAKNFHGGTVPYNWLFADGHVEQFLQDTDPQQWKDHPEGL